jgi:hypothetical protein
LTEPNYPGLAILFLGPSFYFLLTGLLLPPNRPQWNLVVLGLVPGIGLLVCVSDIRERLRALPKAWRNGRLSRQAAAEKTPRRPVPGTAYQGAAWNDARQFSAG